MGKFTGMLSQDQQSNFPSAAYDALQKRKLDQRLDVVRKSQEVENTSNISLKTRMVPHKKSLKPKRMGR